MIVLYAFIQEKFDTFSAEKSAKKRQTSDETHFDVSHQGATEPTGGFPQNSVSCYNVHW
jgi:hypothetical protein